MAASVSGGRVLRSWVSLVVVGLVFVCVFAVAPRAFAVTSQDASSSIASADQALRSAFSGAADAEKSGANVSALMARLNDAGGNLTSAEVALDAGDYSDAVNLANACKSLADGVSRDASVLKADAVAASGLWWQTVLFSAVGSLVVVVVLFLVWRRFRAGYVKRLMTSKPEVAGQ